MTALDPHRHATRDAPEGVSSFELFFRPSIALISLVRTFVGDFYGRLVANPDVASRLALATHELLENTVKYSSDGGAALKVELDFAASTAMVCTRNATTPAQIERLRSIFEEIASAPDASSLYASMLRRSAQSSGSGGLGLARIWAESALALGLGVTGDLVEIEARGSLSTED